MKECKNDCSECPYKTFDSDSSFEFICDIDGHIVEHIVEEKKND